MCSIVRYDKREDIGPVHPDMKTYSHVLMEANATQIALLKDSHMPLAFIQGYSNMLLNAFRFPFFSINLGDKLVLLERVPNPEHPSWTDSDVVFQDLVFSHDQIVNNQN